MSRTRYAISFLYLFILSSGLFHSVLSGSRILSERDLAGFFIPPRLLWVEAIKAGELPLWNPYSFGGHPLLATLQPGIFYPVNIIFLALPFDLAFNWSIIIHFFLAGAFTFLLLRELKASYAASLISAVAFMLSGYLFSVHNVMSTLFSVAWVPLLILLYLRALTRASVFYSVMTGLVLAVMFTGGGIEVLFGSLGLLFLLSLSPQIFFNEDKSSTPIIKRLGLFVVSIAVFLSISAVQLLPFLELANQSTRAEGLSFFEATIWSFDIKDFIQFFIPDIYGIGISEEKYWLNQSWLKTVYIGVIPFMLSVFFFVKSKRKALPFIFTAVIFLVLAMGKNSLFYHYLYSYFPFFNKFRYPVKFLFVFFLFTSIAAGFGFDNLIKGIKEKDILIKRIILAMLAVATISAISFGLMDFYGTEIRAALIRGGLDYPEFNYADINIFNTKRALFFLTVFPLVIYAGLKKERFRKALPYAVVAILSIDLFFAHEGYYISTPSNEYHSKSEAMEFLSKDKGLYRIFVTPKTFNASVEIPQTKAFEKVRKMGLSLDKEKLNGYNIEHHIFDIYGLEVMRRGDFTAVYELMATQKTPDATNILQMLNVKYVLSIPEINSKEFALRKIIGTDKVTDEFEKLKTLKIYENLNYLPRFFLVDDYRVIKKPEEYVKTIPDKNFTPASAALLEEEPEFLKSLDKSGSVQGKIEVLDYRNNSITLKAASSEPALLIAGESYYPGWKVLVDGVETKILKANYVMRGVLLSRGQHEVRFVYCPLSFKIGAYISSATALLLVAAGVFLSIRKKRI
ncbi:MAG: YfhO family protein [Deltaproteobacteria bacterium]|nr:YfhO family protein [Deltaproteobacteria bacterium]